MAQHGDAPGLPVPRRTPIYRDLVLLQLAALVLATDQFSKFLVRQFLLFRESFPAEGFFRITHTYNTGSAFGLFQDQNFPLILASLLGIGVIGLLYHGQGRPTDLLRLSLGLQLGGAAGNLLDRLRLGHVTDFLDVGAWPVFNLADASIVTGLVVLVWILMKSDTGRARKTLGSAAIHLETPADPGANPGGYAWCPVCDGEMRTVPQGWRCSSCGVLETCDNLGSETALGETPRAGEAGPLGVGFR